MAKGRARERRFGELRRGRNRPQRRPGEERPGPLPGAAAGVRDTNAAIHQQTEDEVFGEVRGFADEMMDEVDRVHRNGGNQPAKKRLDDQPVFTEEKVSVESAEMKMPQTMAGHQARSHRGMEDLGEAGGRDWSRVVLGGEARQDSEEAMKK